MGIPIYRLDHRDLKPANIFLIKQPSAKQAAVKQPGIPGQPGGDGQAQGELVKVVDFGIATVVAPEDGDSSGKGQPARLTTPGMVLGTAEYMSPEQAQGLKTDHRVDQYALGCIMYEMLTGKVPFRGATPAATMLKHITEKPVPLSKLRPEIPPELERLVLRAMSTDPAQRYPSLLEVERELVRLFERIRRGSTASATLTLPRAIPKNIKRQHLQLALGAGLGVALMGLVGLLFALRHPSAPTVPGTKNGATAKSAPTTTISWQLRSEPSGATVVRVSDGKTLGKTPFKKNDVPAGEGTTALELRMEGYQTVTVQLSNESDDVSKRQRLQPLAAQKDKSRKKGKGKKRSAESGSPTIY